MELNKFTHAAIIGAGTMGTGIAQLLATSGAEVTIFDAFPAALERSEKQIEKILERLVEKGKIFEEEKKSIQGRITYTGDLNDIAESGIVIEAIIEELTPKREIFSKIEEIVGSDTILATNTSSLSVVSISSVCKDPSRFIGIHFFNPAPIMPLVEIIPGITTNPELAMDVKRYIAELGKVPVIAKDTPGFIVNRVARPFYGEALRIYEEGIADFATIDWAMKEFGGFRMGPFELMDLIGNDVNYQVTNTVFHEMYFDPRFKPSITQKRYVEAGLYGRKSGKGFFDYSENAPAPEFKKNRDLGEKIFHRILAMLINEAADAVLFGIADKNDIDLAMTKGVNYPKGLLKWADDLGIEKVLGYLRMLHDTYGEDRYRPSAMLKRLAGNGEEFYS